MSRPSILTPLDLRRGCEPTPAQVLIEFVLVAAEQAMPGVRAAPATRPAERALEGVRNLARLLDLSWAESSIPRGVTGHDMRRAMVHLLRVAADFVALVTDDDCNWGGGDGGEPLDEKLDEDWHPDAILLRIRTMYLEAVHLESLS